MNLIPKPQEIKYTTGIFKIDHDSNIVLHGGCTHCDLVGAQLLRGEIKKRVGIDTKLTKEFNMRTGCIFLNITDGPTEGYKLQVTPENIIIEGADSKGLFYGVQTLRQILRQHYNEIPAMEISDYPGFKYRGYYFDITRGRVPTLDSLKELCDRLSFYKINQLQLYIEHSFAFRGQSEIWMDKTPITAEEILILDEYCKARKVELVPAMATIGHLYEVLRSESFKGLNELEEVKSYYSWIDRDTHYTLDVSNAESLTLIDGMLKEVLPLFSSNKFNICADETFDLGKGKNKGRAEIEGAGKIYLEFLNKVISIVKKYNRQVMFWGDIMLEHLDYLDEIPNDIIILNWDYSPDPKEDNIRILSEAGFRQYVCPGVWGWNRLMNQMDFAVKNIKSIIGFGKKYIAEGILITDWGDFGNINLFGTSMPGMAYGAGLSWNPSDEISTEEFNQAVSKLEYNDQSRTLISLLNDLGNQSIFEWNMVVRWKEEKLGRYVIQEEGRKTLTTISQVAMAKSYKKAIEIGDKILKLTHHIDYNRIVDVQEFYTASRGIALFNALGLIVKKYDFGQDPPLVMEPKELAQNLEYWFYDYSEIWKARNKESELQEIGGTIRDVCKILRQIR